jgi:hypothetical protein
MIDVKIFVLILIIIYFGYAEAFLRLSDVSDEEGKFIESYPKAILYTFRLSMGDMATDNYDSSI